MRGWTSMLVGFVLLGMAYWSYLTDGLGLSTLLCGAGSLIFFFRGAQGRPAGEDDDPTALIDFVTNPADAIVDSATDRLAEWLGDKPQPATAAAAVVEQPSFDADAALARYMAQRAAEPAAASASPAPYRGFGRKGLQ